MASGECVLDAAHNASPPRRRGVHNYGGDYSGMTSYVGSSKLNTIFLHLFYTCFRYTI